MKKLYHIIDPAKQRPVSPDELTRLLSQNAQLMLPLVKLIEQCRGAVDEVIDVTGAAFLARLGKFSSGNLLRREFKHGLDGGAPGDVDDFVDGSPALFDQLDERQHELRVLAQQTACEFVPNSVEG